MNEPAIKIDGQIKHVPGRSIAGNCDLPEKNNQRPASVTLFSNGDNGCSAVSGAASLSLTRRRKQGFTLIELLVVIAIIAVLVALLLPAVQQAREAARRTQCKNNLVQLGLALHNYEMAFKMLPPGSVNSTGPIQNLPSGYHASWLVQILPFMDQMNLYRAIDLNSSIYDSANATARATKLSSFICPSDSGYRRTTTGSGIAASNYAAVFSGDAVPISATNNGLMFLNSGLGFSKISDGPSNTLMVGEMIQTDDLGWMSGTRATLRHTGVKLNVELDRTYVLPAGSGPPDSEAGGFSSYHAGGAQFLLADGSVRFISDSIDLQKFSWLGNRQDGQIIGEY